MRPWWLQGKARHRLARSTLSLPPSLSFCSLCPSDLLHCCRRVLCLMRVCACAVAAQSSPAADAPAPHPEVASLLKTGLDALLGGKHAASAKAYNEEWLAAHCQQDCGCVPVITARSLLPPFPSVCLPLQLAGLAICPVRPLCVVCACLFKWRVLPYAPPALCVLSVPAPPCSHVATPTRTHRTFVSMLRSQSCTLVWEARALSAPACVPPTQVRQSRGGCVFWSPLAHSRFAGCDMGCYRLQKAASSAQGLLANRQPTGLRTVPQGIEWMSASAVFSSKLSRCRRKGLPKRGSTGHEAID